MVGQYLTSGLTQTEFCRRHGLSLSTLVRRLGRVRHSAEPPAPATRWVAVEVAPDKAAAVCLSSGVVLAVGAYRVELAPGFDGETLRQLLAVLAGR